MSSYYRFLIFQTFRKFSVKVRNNYGWAKLSLNFVGEIPNLGYPTASSIFLGKYFTFISSSFLRTVMFDFAMKFTFYITNLIIEILRHLFHFNFATVLCSCPAQSTFISCTLWISYILSSTFIHVFYWCMSNLHLFSFCYIADYFRQKGK